jgi:hypothetical protein
VGDGDEGDGEGEGDEGDGWAAEAAGGVRWTRIL